MKRLNVKLIRSIHLLLALFIAILFNRCKEPASLNALIISDYEEEVNQGIKAILENTELFDADIADNNSPEFSDYDVVILHLKNAEWSTDTKSAFISYLNEHGGTVILGASAFAFGDWPELGQIAGTPVREGLKKSASAFEFQVMKTDKTHPVTEGLQPRWMHVKDYLSFNTGKLEGEVEVLATSWADTLQGGSGAHLPVIFAVNPGEGRVLHLPLGIASQGDNLSPMLCVGFITTLQRGAEWAATGVVSQEPPLDFPNAASTHEWVDYKPLELDEILKKSMTYEVGKSKKYLNDFSMRIRNCDGTTESYALFEDKIIEFLASDATIDSKKYMCRELSWIGSDKSVTALEKLVNNKDLSEAATYALQRLR